MTDEALIPAGWSMPAAISTDAPGWRTFTGIGMDTYISIALPTSSVDSDFTIQRAFDWFQAVERACSRFDPGSELSRLRAGAPVQVSSLLFELLSFSVEMAKLTNGAFDPTVGVELEAAGFRREYRSGTDVRRETPAEHGSYRDIRLSRKDRTVRLRRQVLIDLGAVAKGLAIDLAAAELSGFPAGCIEAGGDLLVWGEGPSGFWTIGIQHPVQPDRTIATIKVPSGAVCTSAGYERPAEDGKSHHLITRGAHPNDWPESVTVVAPTALAADGLSTAAFLLGARRGLKLVEEQGVEAIVVQPDLNILTTPKLVELISA